MRTPDREFQQDWKGQEITIREWCDPTDHPPCDEVLESEGELVEYDVYIEAEFRLDNYRFSGRSQLGSIGVTRDKEGTKYLQEQVSELTEEAISGLEDEIERIANGEDVTKAMAMQRAIQTFLVLSQ